MPSPLTSRVIVGGSLAVGGFMAMPISAMFLDQKPNGEKLGMAVQIALTVGGGAALGAALPKIAGESASRGKGAIVGAIAGAAALAFNDLVVWKKLLGA